MVRGRTKGSISSVKKDLSHLATLGFLKKKNIMKPVVVKGPAKASSAHGVKKTRTKKVAGYVLNENFKYLAQMKELLVGSEFVHKDDLLGRFRKAGKIKFLAVAGVFTNSPESRLDAMIVADKPNIAALERIVKALEAEVGKELAYAFFPTKEFVYRAEMYDKLIYDMFDFPHETLLDTEQFSTQLLRKRF